MTSLLKHGKILTLFLGLAFLNVGCVQGTSAREEANRPVIVMGLSADYPPFEFKKNGEVVGFDVDLAKELANAAGFELKIQDMDFSAIIPSLQSERIDFAMSGITVNEERKKNLNFSEIYYRSSISAIVPQGSSIQKEADLASKKIGVQLGTTLEKYAKEKAKIFSGLEVVALGRFSILIQELKSARLEGVLVEDAQAQAFVKLNPKLRAISLNQSQDGYAIAFSKSAKTGQTLQVQFNDLIQKFEKNGKLNELRMKWMGANQ